MFSTLVFQVFSAKYHQHWNGILTEMEYSVLSVQVSQISSVIPGVPGVPWGPWGPLDPLGSLGSLGSWGVSTSHSMCLPNHLSCISFIHSYRLSRDFIFENPEITELLSISGLWMAMGLTCNSYWHMYIIYIYTHINYEIVTSISFGHVPSTSSFGCKFLLLTQPLRFPNHFLSSKKDSRAKCQECRPGECHWYLQIWVADKINCSPKFPKVRLGRPLSVVKLFVFQNIQ